KVKLEVALKYPIRKQSCTLLAIWNLKGLIRYRPLKWNCYCSHYLAHPFRANAPHLHFQCGKSLCGFPIVVIINFERCPQYEHLRPIIALYITLNMIHPET